MKRNASIWYSNLHPKLLSKKKRKTCGGVGYPFKRMPWGGGQKEGGGQPKSRQPKLKTHKGIPGIYNIQYNVQ